MLEYTVVVIGSGGVGKTSLTVQLVEGKFDEEYNPTIEDSYQKQLDVDGQKVLLNILDTAGQEEYAVLRDQYWRSGDGFFIVYDITNTASFAEIESFFNMIKKAKDVDNYPIVLCANKSDLEGDRKVTKDDAKALAKKYGWSIFDTSAKQRLNVEESFLELVRAIKKHKEQEEGEANVNQDLKSIDSKKKKKGLLGLFKKKK